MSKRHMSSVTWFNMTCNVVVEFALPILTKTDQIFRISCSCFSSKCSVIASVPLPPLPWSRVAEAGLVEILLEEWLLRPLQSLASVRPMAELYRLKRKIMDSPFRRKTGLTFLRDVTVTQDSVILQYLVLEPGYLHGQNVTRMSFSFCLSP